MRFHVFSLVLACALAACGGGSGSSSGTAQPTTTAGTFIGTAPDTTAGITVTDPQVVSLPSMYDALVVGDHIVCARCPPHPSTSTARRFIRARV